MIYIYNYIKNPTATDTTVHWEDHKSSLFQTFVSRIGYVECSLGTSTVYIIHH